MELPAERPEQEQETLSVPGPLAVAVPSCSLKWPVLSSPGDHGHLHGACTARHHLVENGELEK